MLHTLYKLKSNIIRNIGANGGYRIARYLTRHFPRILMYHRFSKGTDKNKVSSETFEKQILELTRNFNIVPLQEFVDCLNHDNSLPSNSIVLTIDDGYRDFFDVAFPVLKRYKLPATLYVTVDFIDGTNWLWPDRISYILQQSKLHAIRIKMGSEDVKFNLNMKSDHDAIWVRLINYCISLQDDERQLFIIELSKQAEIKMDMQPPAEFAPLSWEQINELSANNINIGAHTRTHPILSKVSAAKLDGEIYGCKKILEDKINQTVTSFCYPNGQMMDISPLVKNIVKESGYTDACVAFCDGESLIDPYELRRIAVSENMFQFYKAVSGVELLVCKLRKLIH